MSASAPVPFNDTPGPTSWAPGGSYWAFRRDPLAFFTTTARTYGGVAAFHLANRRVYLISDPALIEQVLTGPYTRYGKGVALQRARRLLGNGLLTAAGAEHMKHRRMIQPLFHRQHVQGFAEAMVRHALRWSDAVTPGARLDITHEMGGLALAIVGDTLFSTNVREQADEVREALAEAVQGFGLSFVPFTKALEKLPIPPFSTMRRASRRLDGVIRRVIAERRRQEGEAGTEVPALQQPALQRPTPDLLSMLLDARDPDHPTEPGMSDQQIRDEALTIFLAGHETTANAMAWTWHLLASAPNVEARLHREIAEVLGGRTPAAADVPHLDWARAIISESMRLWPPAWTMGRSAMETHDLGGHRVEEGSLLICSQYVVHRDPRWWPSPDQFAPERWLQPAPDRPRYAYFPFGGGSRICIGESFAWTEAILLLATIARRWRFVRTADPAPEPEPRITLRPKNLYLRAEAR